MIPRKLKLVSEIVAMNSTVVKVPVHWLDGLNRSTLCSNTQECPVCEFQAPKDVAYCMCQDEPDAPVRLLEMPGAVGHAILTACERKLVECCQMVVVLSKEETRYYRVADILPRKRLNHRIVSSLGVLSAVASMYRLPEAKSGESLDDYWLRLGKVIDKLNTQRLCVSA